jgi:endo-1,4-beta-xylanase
VANEVLDGTGLRSDVPWYMTIGEDYVARAFHEAHRADPNAVLVLNDFGFEVDDDFALAADKRRAALELIDAFRHERVPIHALGVQAHLSAKTFYGFDPDGYRHFLSQVADRGLQVIVTELDVLDDGLPADPAQRDSAVADVYTRYLHATLAEPSVRAVMTVGLSDRYTWLQEDYPRGDDAPRRPLPFDERLRPKPAYDSLHTMLADAPERGLAWRPPRCA